MSVNTKQTARPDKAMALRLETYEWIQDQQNRTPAMMIWLEEVKKKDLLHPHKAKDGILRQREW